MADQRVVAAVLQVMHEHGTDLLFPDDELDCCAEALASLFERVAWYFPTRQPGERFFRGDWEPHEDWTGPYEPVFRLRPAPEGEEADHA